MRIVQKTLKSELKLIRKWYTCIFQVSASESFNNDIAYKSIIADLKDEINQLKSKINNVNFNKNAITII